MIEKIRVTRSDNDLATKTLEAINKINELVDAVNEIMTWRFETDEDSDWYDDPKCREQPSDPYAEQCKWIGKLCWYKLCEGDTWKVGRLEKIQENADAGYPFVFNGLGYKICESLVL